MANKITRENIAKNVFFNNVKDDRFKTMKVSVTMFVPLKKETAAANALLPMLLARSCAKYPDATSFNKKLNSLYGADISGYCRKMGESLAITVSASAIDDRYTLNKENLSEELVELLCSLIFEPKLENNEFSKNDFEQEKRQLLENIDSEFSEKRIYALNRCTQLMCKDEAFGIPRYGSKEDVENLCPPDIFIAWQNMLKMARFELMVLGNSDASFALNVFKKAFKNIERESVSSSTQIVKTVDEVKEQNEMQDIAQCKLVMGFRCGAAEPEDNTMAMRLAVAILGGTASSKFFLNVREKYSLCYYCAARYDRQKGIVIVDSGVEKENIERAKEEIINQLNIFKSGDVTDFEIDSAKRSMANSYISLSDTLSGTEGWYITQMLDKEIYSPEAAVELINNVTKEEVIQAANTIVLDTIYLLQPNE